jgi:hypothetical protein
MEMQFWLLPLIKQNVISLSIAQLLPTTLASKEGSKFGFARTDSTLSIYLVLYLLLTSIHLRASEQASLYTLYVSLLTTDIILYNWQDK